MSLAVEVVGARNPERGGRPDKRVADRSSRKHARSEPSRDRDRLAHRRRRRDLLGWDSEDRARSLSWIQRRVLPALTSASDAASRPRRGSATSRAATATTARDASPAIRTGFAVAPFAEASWRASRRTRLPYAPSSWVRSAVSARDAGAVDRQRPKIRSAQTRAPGNLGWCGPKRGLGLLTMPRTGERRNLITTPSHNHDSLQSGVRA
jgi:hypothetical protein